MTYAEKLKDPRWQRKRLEVLNRDKFTCQCCQATLIELHIHHKKYSGEPWEAPSEDLITLCKHCHLVVESWKQIPDFIRWNRTRQACFFLHEGILCFEDFSGNSYGAIPFNIALEFANEIIQYQNSLQCQTEC